MAEGARQGHAARDEDGADAGVRHGARAGVMDGEHAARNARARRAGPARVRPLFGSKRRRRCRRISNVRSAPPSTSARRARRSMRPTRPTTGRCRSGSSIRARGRRWSKPSASAASTTRRSSPAAAAPALPARAATSRCASTSRGTCTSVIEIDPAARTGARRARLHPRPSAGRGAAHGLMFGPDPATHDHNTLGGMIGNDSCGVHSVKWGRTARQCRPPRSS